ncbi:lectin 7-like [Gastrolobium bilobum]|uniref:lectin 7-like n=1 Tax=Gastrolobium bilobum TaxID=150636 RepID=UPI002AB2FB44|nr:lectin 7-like [Gastrolobium bilobum]
MVLYNSKPVFLILISFLLMHHNSMTSFEFPNFHGPYTNDIITFQGDAFASNGVIQLTKIVNDTIIPSSAGRAFYALPKRLWDPKTGKLASFTSTFSFVVTTNGPGIGDGISFFIAPLNSTIPNNSGGGYLGLFSPESASDTSRNQIVAVEFDTFHNPWDPAEAHIGIDINSIVSVKTVPWQHEDPSSSVTTVFATVTYEPLAQNLSVIVSYPESIVHEPTISLSHLIDLTTVLPEWVSVGFSGSTGVLVEEHEILSWTFSSTI